nr:hypothetical protein [Tanacetum cinerariifolium]
MNPRGGSAAGYGGVQNRVENVNPGQARPDLALNVDNVFQADDCDPFDSDVDEALTAQTMFMANLSSADPVTDEAGPSCGSDILSEVKDHDHYQDAVCAHHEEHAMHESVQLDDVVDSHADYTSDSNMIMYDQYVKDNEVPVVHSNVSSVPNDAFMMIYNDMSSSSTQVPQPLADSSSPAEDLIKNLTNTLGLLTQSYRTFLPQTNNQLRTSSNARNQATVQDGRVVVQNVQGRPNRVQGMNLRGRSAAGYGGAHNKVRNVNPGPARSGQARPVKCYNCNGGQDNAFDDDVDEQPVQDLALNVDTVFQADDCDAFDSDVDEAPTAQTMFMANLSSADPVTDEAEPSYDSDILSEYVKDNEVPVVHSDVSYVPNDAFMMIYNDMCESHAQSVSNPSWNTVVKNSLTAKLATYKEHVELYEQRAKFELTEREQKINEQLRLVISDRNFKEETLKRELLSLKLQLASTINQHKSMDTLEIAEITRKKMNDKMNDPEYVTRKVKIAPHDYSKENLVATFTPQKQLTPEQIFWSNDLMKLKSEALKERTKGSRPIKALTVYLPNTPATLVPKVLPTKSQVKIHIFTLIQLFSEFDKTCKKRITPTGLTEGERGFEQTKECFLKEVIPFFKTLKENFEGIQKALTKEIKEMKDVFEELEAELKYQNLKDSIGNNPPTPDKDTPDFDSVFVIGKMQASLQGKDNVIRQLKKQLSQLQVTRSDTDRNLQV